MHIVPGKKMLVIQFPKTMPNPMQQMTDYGMQIVLCAPALALPPASVPASAPEAKGRREQVSCNHKWRRTEKIWKNELAGEKNVDESLVEKDVDESMVKNKYGIVVERKQDTKFRTTTCRNLSTFIATCCQCGRKVGKGIGCKRFGQEGEGRRKHGKMMINMA